MASSNFEVNFCGGEFWNANLTWYTENPDFTKCFQKTVFAWTPSAFFFFFAIFELKKFSAKGHDKGSIRPNPYNLTKIVLALTLVSLSVAEIALWALKNDAYPADYLAPIVFLVTFMASTGHQLLSMRYGVRTSSSQFYLYFFWVVCGGFTVRSTVQDGYNDDTYPLFVTHIFMYAVACAMFILNLFADSAPAWAKDEPKDCPRLSASYFSKLIYMWSVKLLWKGWRNPLEPSDLWDLDPKLTSK